MKVKRAPLRRETRSLGITPSAAGCDPVDLGRPAPPPAGRTTLTTQRNFHFLSHSSAPLTRVSLLKIPRID